MKILLSLYQNVTPLLEDKEFNVLAVPQVGEQVIYEAEPSDDPRLAAIFKVTDVTHWLGGYKGENNLIRVTATC